MASKKLKTRLTCFLCRYEITKHNKSEKRIVFRGNLKNICRYCTKNNHKILRYQFKNVDIQCKVCNKPSRYKNCIKCSICDHLFHGKCLELSKKDIENIEKVCDHFICIKCNEDTFPRHVDNENKNVKLSKTKLKQKQCLTCDNIVPKEIYPNKHILYNEKRHLLCQNCSKLGLNIPVRDQSMIEFQDCAICCKQVKYQSIFCNLCQHLVHPYCNGINKQQLNNLSKLTENWYCKGCNSKIFPNYLLSKKPEAIIKTNQAKIKQDFITYDDCSVCTKKVTGNETLSCSTCNHWVHKKCIGEFKNRTEFQKFLHHYSFKHWDCPTRTSEMLPFIFLDNDEFFMLLLDIFSKPTYLNIDNIKNVYIKLKGKDFFKTEYDNDNKQDKYFDNIDPDLNYFDNDICDYIVDTDDINFQPSNELTMMTFNIRSIKKNFNNFEQLLSRFKSKIHIICLTETWLKESDNIKDFEIEGYHTPQMQNRSDNLHGGGVMTYIHKDIQNHKTVKTLSFNDNFNNCLATEIQINNKNITILNIYRSPNNLNETF